MKLSNISAKYMYIDKGVVGEKLVLFKLFSIVLDSFSLV